jgi:hypothetical protein
VSEEDTPKGHDGSDLRQDFHNLLLANVVRNISHCARVCENMIRRLKAYQKRLWSATFSDRNQESFRQPHRPVNIVRMDKPADLQALERRLARIEVAVTGGGNQSADAHAEKPLAMRVGEAQTRFRECLEINDLSQLSSNRALLLL